MASKAKKKAKKKVKKQSKAKRRKPARKSRRQRRDKRKTRAERDSRGIARDLSGSDPLAVTDPTRRSKNKTSSYLPRGRRCLAKRRQSGGDSAE